jgi:serine/threonine-protein kinase
MPRAACPTSADLTAFLLGDLPETELDEFAEHLERCPRCEKAARALDGLTDPRLAPFRGAARARPAPAATERPGRVGDYEVLGEVGRGGMGVVYKARHLRLGRVVALKMMLGGHLAGPEQRQRFRAEAEAVARLQHPNIVQLFEAGEHDAGGEPRPYFTLEFAEGGSLAERLAGQPLPPRQAADWLRSLACAVHYAHTQGVIHRDLKPSNVLLTGDGRPKVCDFGVAKLLSGSDQKTHSGLILGTAEYMAPEQAEAKTAPGPAADVYALGVILYEMLTGRPPFKGATTLDTLSQVRAQEPVPLRRLQPSVPRDLETICLKCLSKDPARRYASAADLAADVRRHLRHEPIRARPPSALYQLGKFALRHRALVATTAAFLALLLVGGAVTAWQAVALARAERDQAVRQALRSREVHEALGRAGALREQARATGGPAKWAKAREEARRAEALAEGGPVEPGLAERVGLLLRDMNEEEADRRLVARLEEAWLLQAEVNFKENRFVEQRALPRYRQAFADYGLLPGSTVPAEAAARIQCRPPGVRGPALAALDDWLDVAREEKAAEAGWLERVLAAADPDDWRQRLRAAREKPDRQALEDLAREVKVAAQPAQVVVLLGRALVASGSIKAAAELLRRAWFAYPGDFWVNLHLGWALATSRPPQPDAAIRFFMVAVALRPSSPGARLNLGNELQARGQLDEAIACFHKAIELDPKFAEAHNNLGNALQARGQLDEAIACFKKAIELDPKFAQAHNNLGVALQARGQVDEAIACYEKAIELDPKYANARNNLGIILCDVKQDYDRAIACFRKAIELGQKLAEAHSNLGVALQGRGRADEAIACFHKAIEFDPKYARAHYNLGVALQARGRADEAIACFKKAIELDPKYARAHNNLGNALQARGQLDEAIACFKKAIELDPNFPEAHCNLGYVLKERGDFAEALGPFRCGDELGRKRGDWQYPSAAWVRDCERLIEREKKLLAVLGGSSEPADARERLEWARLCVQTRRYAAAARLSGEAFRAEEKLANDLEAGHRYRAGAAAALAGAGQGRDAGNLTNEARVALRKQALAWLKADLAAWRSHSEGGQRARALRGWRADQALAGVRDEEGLAQLPPPERAAWAELWAAVEKLLNPAR